MRSSNHERLILRSLKRSLGLPLPRSGHRAALGLCFDCRRRFSSAPALSRPSESQDVAVLGGGITGLASAYYLSKADPRARITVYEKSDRFGGWVNSEVVRSPSGEKALVLERGPRTLRLRGNGSVTLKLVEELELQDECIFVGEDDPSALNRYIYDGERLRRLPNPQLGFLQALLDLWDGRHVFFPPIKGLLHDFHYQGREPDEDESVGSFLSRRFNKETADFVSAMSHGIYAGDIDRLSIRSLAPRLPYVAKYRSSLLRALEMTARGTKPVDRNMIPLLGNDELEPLDGRFATMSRSSVVYTFKDGLSTLAEALRRRLAKNENVRLLNGVGISGINAPDSDRGKLTLDVDENGSSTQKSHSVIISTLPHNSLCALYPPDVRLDRFVMQAHSPYSNSGSILKQIVEAPPAPMPTVTVMVVNLYFASQVKINGSGAFGYLIPRSVPFERNPERALGVVFDSFAAPGQDASSGSKLTVMLGGHWWDGLRRLPSEEEGVEMARNVLRRHLGLDEEPVIARATLQRDCIPQYTVGHHRRMWEFHTKLLHDFGGRLKVAGCSYGGVGVNDCVRAAWDLGQKLDVVGWGSTFDSDPWTALERYHRPEIDVVDVIDLPDGTWTLGAAAGSPNAPKQSKRP